MPLTAQNGIKRDMIDGNFVTGASPLLVESMLSILLIGGVMCKKFMQICKPHVVASGKATNTIVWMRDKTPPKPPKSLRGVRYPKTRSPEAVGFRWDGTARANRTDGGMICHVPR